MRAIYGHSLTPQECYDLAEDWGDYHGLLQGTSWYVYEWGYLTPEKTYTCFHLWEPPFPSEQVDTCAVPPPPVVLPGCPDAVYSRTPECEFTVNGGGPSPCPCLTDNPVTANYTEDIGEWGSWVAVFETCGGGPVTVTFTPYYVDGGYVEWAIVVATFEGSAETQGTWTCGTWPWANVAHIMSGPCPFADLSVRLVG